MNNSPQRYQVINLLDLLWYLCYHWRSLIVGMLLCALLASGLRLYKNDAYNAGIEAQLAAQDKDSSGEEQSTYDSLTQTEARAVDNAVLYTQQIQQYLDYQKNSVYINLDPYNENVQILNYIVEVRKDDIAEDGMDASALADLLKQSYVGYVNSGAAAGAVKAIDADMEQSAIDELISAIDLTSISDSSSLQTGSFSSSGSTTNFNMESDSNIDRAYAVFEVTVLGSSKEDAGKLADALDQTLSNYTKTLTDSLDVHTLTLSAANSSIVVDGDLVTARQNYNTNLINARTNLNNLLTAFTENQKLAYESMTDMQSDAINETEGTDSVVPDKIPLTSGLVKYLILGLFLGIFLWAVLWAMIYILVPTLKTTEDITRCFRYYLMADLTCYQDSNKRFGSGMDKFLRKLRYRDALPLEEEQRLLATNLKVTCKKEEVSSVYLTSSYVMSEAEMQRIDALIQSLAMDNISAVYGRSIERDAESYEKMTEVGAVVYIERLGKSRFDSLEKINAMTEKQGVKILGVVVM